MFKKVVFSILILTSFAHTYGVSVYNDLQDLASDTKFWGFSNAPVYIEGVAVHAHQTIHTPSNPNGYTLEIDVPADFAAEELGGQTLSSVKKFFLSYCRCVLHITFNPENSNDRLFVTELLFEHSMQEPRIEIRLRGIRSVTAYIHNA